MRKLLISCLCIFLLVDSTNAVSFTAPQVPDSGQAFMPVETESFGDALWEMLQNIFHHVEPELTEAIGIAAKILCICLALGLFSGISGKGKETAEMAAVLGTTLLLLSSAKAMIIMSADTVTEISEYGKLLLPVMTAAMAAQGGITSSTALYAGTILFSTMLTSLIQTLLLPMVYMFLAVSLACSICSQELLKKLRDLIKWLLTWCLKTILYIFTGYISITGVVSGTADAAAVKAAKLTISGIVPVVGGILSDTSEAVLVSAGLVKNSVGIYGMLAVAAIAAAPFLQTGIHYLILKGTGTLCDAFGTKRITQLVESFSAAMGLLLAMIGALCLILIISTVCYMRGMS